MYLFIDFAYPSISVAYVMHWWPPLAKVQKMLTRRRHPITVISKYRVNRGGARSLSQPGNHMVPHWMNMSSHEGKNNTLR